VESKVLMYFGGDRKDCFTVLWETVFVCQNTLKILHPVWQSKLKPFRHRCYFLWVYRNWHAANFVAWISYRVMQTIWRNCYSLPIAKVG